ncbi:alpha/beta fold hydrolase [Allostreptomyces psammosilenae]|uniref:Pimeloyl-ACP methyl ester carboxylesterase n=1 Tax=Allostreptomyces psammosilenae TaxID=1892865 RepID=A0A852ZXJ7_9ACTN|nr:alpha/beta fold hydrolase [Allostreptomyces psammosilenae]NYI06477.1 pimeloyl-ACP methyl ester carboxylesterase [Allostreptomyces psammosilenae]
MTESPHPFPASTAGADTLFVRESGVGHPVVLLHAFPLSSRMWAAHHDGLISDSCRLITPDLRGAGRTPLGPDAPDLDVCADDVAALLDAAGLDRAVVGGVSMGGYVALAFARRHPERLSGLVLADTKAAADTEEARANRLRIAETLEREGTTRVLLENVPNLVGETTRRQRPDTLAEIEAMVRETPARGAAWAQRAMAARPDSGPGLARVEVPALVLVGEEDTITPPEHAGELAEALPNALLETVPQAGHLAAVEDPRAFAGHVVRFVAALGED